MSLTQFAYDAKTHTFSFDPSTEGFFNLAWQITRRCNLNCLPCCESDPTSELTTEEFQGIANELKRHGTKRVCLTGGEPTIRKDFVQVVDMLYNAQILVTLASNCLNLPPLIPSLKGKIANVRTTIFGIESTHNRVAQNPTAYARLRSAVKTIVENGIPVYACMTLMQSNLDELPTVCDVCQDWRIERLLAFSLMNKGRGQNIFAQESVSDDAVQEQLAKIKGNVYWSNFMREGQCAMIDPKGDLIATPCYSSPTRISVIGSVLTEGLCNLWQNYPYKENYFAYYGEKTK